MNNFRSLFAREFKAGVKYGLRLYFVPLVGAYRGIRAEYKRIDEESREQPDPHCKPEQR
jgi:hypothetical protein